jgi:hypothetical protein
MPISAVDQLVLSRGFDQEVFAPLSELFTQLGIVALVNYCTPSSNSALTLELEGPSRLGRITLWQDGSYHSEALRGSDGLTIHSLHGMASSASNVVVAVRQLANMVAGRSTHIGC